MATIIVDVMLRADSADEQADALLQAVPGATARVGKRFYLSVPGAVSDATVAEARRAARALVGGDIESVRSVRLEAVTYDWDDADQGTWSDQGPIPAGTTHQPYARRTFHRSDMHAEDLDAGFAAYSGDDD